MTENEIKTYKYPDDFINKIICGDCLELVNYHRQRRWLDSD
jgi:hypothetical protein